MSKLYHHKTDGGAEYLCVKAVEGTTEGDIRFAAVRLDGQPELLGAYSAAPKMLAALRGLLEHAADLHAQLDMTTDPEGKLLAAGQEVFAVARAAIAKAEGK